MRAIQAPAPAAAPDRVEEVLAAMYERYAGPIFGFCRRRLRTPQQAEDAVQNTFVSAMQALQRGTVPVCEAAWLYKIAENACYAIYRSDAKRIERELTDPESLSRFAWPEACADALVGLGGALESLTPKQRGAFLLRDVRGLSYDEIAAELDVTVASVETLIYRARRGLARALESGAGVRRRARAAFDLGSTAAAAKAWLAGLSAAKVAAAGAVVAVAAVPALTAADRDRAAPPADIRLESSPEEARESIAKPAVLIRTEPSREETVPSAPREGAPRPAAAGSSPERHKPSAPAGPESPATAEAPASGPAAPVPGPSHAPTPPEAEAPRPRAGEVPRLPPLPAPAPGLPAVPDTLELPALGPPSLSELVPAVPDPLGVLPDPPVVG